MSTPTEGLLRDLAPQVLGGLLRRGTAFSDAEDAVQEALVEATTRWVRDGVPAKPAAWLHTVATRKIVDAARSDAARRRREATAAAAPAPGPAEQVDDTLALLFLCCHPSLSPSAAVALTLRAVGGLTTREIATAYLVPEATVAQRISRAKRTLADRRLDRPGDIAEVMRVLYLIFNEGYTPGADHVDLATEAIRLTRALHRAHDAPEVAGLLALMLLHHARRPARTDEIGALVPLSEQDRSRWPQILAWYDELVEMTANPLAVLSRAVAVGEVHGPVEALRSLEDLDEQLKGHHRLHAVRAHLLEAAGNRSEAAELFVTAADCAPSSAERTHLLRRAAAAARV